MRSEWIQHKGRRILFSNLTHLTLDELRAEIKASDELILREAKNSVLYLADLAGTLGSPAVIDIFSKSGALTKSYVRRTAVIGVSGVRKTLVDIVIKLTGVQVMVFGSLEEAKDGLVNAK